MNLQAVAEAYPQLQANQILISAALTAIQTKITSIWNAIVAFLTPLLIRICIACQMVSNRYLNASSKGLMVL